MRKIDIELYQLPSLPTALDPHRHKAGNCGSSWKANQPSLIMFNWPSALPGGTAALTQLRQTETTASKHTQHTRAIPSDPEFLVHYFLAQQLEIRGWMPKSLAKVNTALTDAYIAGFLCLPYPRAACILKEHNFLVLMGKCLRNVCWNSKPE